MVPTKLTVSFFLGCFNSSENNTILLHHHQASSHSRVGRLPSISHHAPTKPCRFNNRLILRRAVKEDHPIETQPSQLTWSSQALDLRHPISRPPPSNQKLMYRRSVSTLLMGLRSKKLMTQGLLVMWLLMTHWVRKLRRGSHSWSEAIHNPSGPAHLFCMFKFNLDLRLKKKRKKKKPMWNFNMLLY